MKAHVLLITFLSLLKLNHALFYHFVLDRFGYGEANLKLSTVNISKHCDAKEKCLWMCCPHGQIMGLFKTCIPSHEKLANITVYDRKLTATNGSLESVFKIVPHLMKDATFSKNAVWWRKARLREDGKLFLKFPNMYNRWKEIETNHFCVDMKNGTEFKPIFMVEYKIDSPRQPSAYNKWGLIVSIFFLTLTLLVYVIVPQLRNLNGILLMVHFGFLIIAFITYTILESYDGMRLKMFQILNITFAHYFFLVSSFCWTNVMFYRILLSRDEAQDASVLKELVKYSTYAIGLPVLLTIILATIEMGDMSDSPSFVTPQILNKGNFAFHEMESLYYLYIPLLLLLAFNWIVCIIKAVQFLKSSKQFSVVNTANETQETTINSTLQFVKLLTVLTCFWLLEVVTMMYPKHVNNISATFNMCMGPIILILFVWDQNVIKLLSEQLTKAKESNSHQLATFFQKK